MSADIILIGIAIGLAGLAIVFALIAFAPAHTVLEIDTAQSLAMARVRPLWGLAPEITFMRNRGDAKHSKVARLVRTVRDIPRMAHAALAFPRLIGPLKQLLTDIDALKPSTKRIIVSAPAIHPVASVLFELGSELPASVRRGFEVRTHDRLSADLSAHIVADASPIKLWGVYRRFRGDAGVQEFFRRLRREPASGAS